MPRGLLEKLGVEKWEETPRIPTITRRNYTFVRENDKLGK